MRTHWTMPEQTAALIFDCDGTLADTMPIHYRAWIAMLGTVGISFSEERFYQLGGMPTSKIIQLLAAETGVPVQDVEALVEQKENHFLTLLHEVQPIPPVFAIAQQYMGRMPMAVASGGYRAVVQRTLETIGAAHWFGAIVCAEDTPKHKPEPDVFLEAARRLGTTNTANVIVFEDTNIGMEAARRAGMQGIDVRDWLPPRPGENRQ